MSILPVIAVALAPLSVVAAYEDFKKLEISPGTNIVLLFLLIISLVLVAVESALPSIALILEWVLLTALSGGADARLAVAQAASLYPFLHSYTLLYPFFAYGFYAILPDREFLNALLNWKLFGALVMVIAFGLIFPESILYIAVIIILFKLSVGVVRSVHFKPVAALEDKDRLAECIAISGQRKAHHQLAYDRYPWLMQIPAYLSLPIAITLGKSIIKKEVDVEIPVELTEENIAEVKEKLLSLGIDTVLVHKKVPALAYSITPFYLLTLVVILLYRLFVSW